MVTSSTVVVSKYDLKKLPGHWLGSFSAMASPCLLLVDGGDLLTMNRLTTLVQTETHRIEAKFSRYRHDNIIHEINTADGRAVCVDEETGLLLNFADQCYQLSDGLFDVSSGILRKVWKFDGSDRIPAAGEIIPLMASIGWEKIHWESPEITLQKGMEIDLGGIGKEYAVDRCYDLLAEEIDLPFMLNFGGDLRASGVRRNGQPWKVGVENPSMQDIASKTIKLRQGALATSGDSRRFLQQGSKRYSHILNPKTCWPVENAPRSVTVAAATTIEAGMLATFASLQGANAGAFLEAQRVQYWILH